MACTLLAELETKYDVEEKLIKTQLEPINEFAEQRVNTNELYQNHPNARSQPKGCYIDLDILGTGAKHFIFGDKLLEENIKYLNDIKQVSKYKEYMNELTLSNQKFTIDCILMNERAEEKNRFISSARPHTSSVNINVFENIAKNVLNLLVDDNNYDFIVIDCAPSYDSFSRSIYKYIKTDLCREYPNKIKNVDNLFVTTLDQSHILNTIRDIHSIKNQTQYPDVKIVLNDTLGYFNDNEKIADEFVEKVVDKYREICEENIKRSGNGHKASKTTFCRKSIAIKKHSQIAINMYFGNGKQLYETNLYKEIDDRDLLVDLALI